MFASAHDFPKFVTVGAAMEHELRKVGTGVATSDIAISVAVTTSKERQSQSHTSIAYLPVSLRF